MKCMSAGIEVAYADLFTYKTPLALEQFILARKHEKNRKMQSAQRKPAAAETARRISSRIY